MIPISHPDQVSEDPPASIEMKSVVRVGGKGAEWNSPACQEINAICDELDLTAVQICRELQTFDGIKITRESLQSYKQGNVLGQEPYEALLARLRPYLQMRRTKYGRLMSSSAIEIIDGWMNLLNIDMTNTSRSPWKEFSSRIGTVNRNGKMVTIDHTTIYRWYHSNKKPASLNDLIWYDDKVTLAAKKKL
jgi:hypothetical protein